MSRKKEREKSQAAIGGKSLGGHKSGRGDRRNGGRLLRQLIDRGIFAIERIVRASSKREVRNLLAGINEVEFLMELSRLAVKNLDSEPLGLPGRTAGERRRINLVRRLAQVVETKRDTN